MDDETPPIPLSALQHAVYCLRQAALIHIERAWAENRFTAEGTVVHETVHEPGLRRLQGVRRVTGLPLACKRLGLAGTADLVEFIAGPGGEQPFPVEYKRGKPKSHRADEVQLCAQALCLEEMTGRPVPDGALFYAEPKRRTVVAFDPSLRRLTEETAAALKDLFATGRTPPARPLQGLALPRLFAPGALPPPVPTRRQGLDASDARRASGRRASVRKVLNTVYVTTEGAALRKDGENLVAEVEGAERARVPLHLLASVVVFGPVFVSPALIGACAGAGITMVLLDRSGRFQARIEGPVSGNVLLRRAQYRASEQPAEIVRSLVLGKVANQRAVLMRALRDHGPDLDPSQRVALNAAVDRLERILRKVQRGADDADALRGQEVEAAAHYFGCFDAMIRSADPAFRFTVRSRRPPLDRVNALLSFLYTLLVHECRAAAESVGLDPAVGFLHRDRPGRPSLALDLMEDLRPVLADRLALSLINCRQIGPDDFEVRDGGAVLLGEKGRKTVLTAWQERKKEERRHAFLDEVAPFGLVPHLQAQLLARHLRGDLDAYPPWFWK